MTLLEALCQANGQQGGTIHHFFPDDGVKNVLLMERSYAAYVKCGLEFPSRASFDKLAHDHGLTINWGTKLCGRT
jgi:hypothetical protein